MTSSSEATPSGRSWPKPSTKRTDSCEAATAQSVSARFSPTKDDTPISAFGATSCADLGDFLRPPQHRHGGDREAGAPGAEQCQRRHGEIGELGHDRVAGLEPRLDEERGERIDGRVGLAVGEGFRLAEAERREVGRIAKGGHPRSLAGATPQ